MNISINDKIDIYYIIILSKNIISSYLNVSFLYNYYKKGFYIIIFVLAI